MRYGVSLLVLSLVAGCGRKPAPSAAAKTEDSPRATAEFVQPIGPSEERWKTEQFSKQIDQYFANLSHLLTAEGLGDGRGERGCLDFVSEDFAGDSLRPTGLKSVRDESGIRVLRWYAKSTDTLQKSVRGRAGLLSEFLTFLPSDAGESRRMARSKFKVVSVERSKDALTTDILWQSMVANAKENLQRTSNWRCGWRISKDDALELASLDVESVEEVAVSTTRAFVDATGTVMDPVADFASQFGQSVDYWYDRLEHRYSILPTGYQGIAIADVNGDGLDDVFVPQPGGVIGGLPNRLFVQQTDGTVLDRSAESGLDWLIETHSALFVDFDNDGDQDIVVATVMGLVFAANDGTGRFERRATKLTPDAPPMSLAAADFDNDQDLDLYVCCYSPRNSSPLMGRPIPYHDANNGGRNLLLRNDRDWRFRDVTQQVGMSTNNRRFSFAASWEDFDKDGDLDVYVANDYGRNNLFENNDGQFRDVAGSLGVEDISAGMGVTWGDYNNDGWSDLYVSNMWSSAGKRIAFQRTFQSDADEQTRSLFQRHARGNSLFENRCGSGNARFDDVSPSSGATMGRWAWCSKFSDINNDGNEDLLVANGFITQEKSDDL